MILELICSRKLSGELSLFVMQYFLLVLAGEVLNRIHDHADFAMGKGLASHIAVN